MIFKRHELAVIVPITGTTAQVLVEETEAASEAGADVVEWRIDHLFGHHPNFSFGLLGREIIPQLLKATTAPLLLTIRTAFQGGEIKLSQGRYRLLLAEMLDTLMQLQVPADRIAIDVEFWYAGAPDIAARARDLGYTVVVSHHDWVETPDDDIMRIMIDDMLEIPEAVAKLAVTATNESDVDRLLRVTRDVTTETDRPVITLSMGMQGRRSRLEGRKYGSVATFATVVNSSAPGQPSLAELREALAADDAGRA